MKDKIANILKEYTKKNGISASFVILEEYAEELVKNGCTIHSMRDTYTKICNGCEFLNIDEYEEYVIKYNVGCCPPHKCKKYNKQVTHFPHSESYIRPCEECEKGGAE